MIHKEPLLSYTLEFNGDTNRILEQGACGKLFGIPNMLSSLTVIERIDRVLLPNLMEIGTKIKQRL